MSNYFNFVKAIQNEFNSLVIWLNNIGPSMNINTCQVVSFTRHQSPIYFDHSINDSFLTRVFVKKDLSILFTSNLNFHPHIELVICKAIKILEFIRHIYLAFKPFSYLKELYCTLFK